MKDLEKELLITKNSLHNLARIIMLYINYEHKVTRHEYSIIRKRIYEMAYKIKVKIENELYDNKR